METAMAVLIISVIAIFIIGRIRQEKSGEERDPINWKSLLTWQRGPVKCRGYPGILGAILTLVGLHLPFVHILFIRISYKEALAETGPYDPTWAIVGTLLVALL